MGLRDFENDELGRFYRRDAADGYDLAQVDALRCISFAVTFHEEGFLGRAPHQRSIPPHGGQKTGEYALDGLPESSIVGLKNYKASASQDRLSNPDEEPANIDVTPLLPVQCARSPGGDSEIAEGPNA